MRATLLLLVLAATPPARAEPPRVTAPATAAKGEIVQIEVRPPEGKEFGYQPTFDVTEGGFFRLQSDDPGVSQFLFQPKAEGRFAVVFWTIGEKKGVAHTIQVGAAPPVPAPPKPEPGPQPKPDPAPIVPSKLFVVVVEETADAVAARGVMFNSPALSARMKDKGHKWRVVDKDVVTAGGTVPADVKRFLDKSSGKAYPQVFLVDETGRTRVQADLPQDPAKLLDLITSAGG